MSHVTTSYVCHDSFLHGTYVCHQEYCLEECCLFYRALSHQRSIILSILPTEDMVSARMSHSTRLNVSRHTYKLVSAHGCMSHGAGHMSHGTRIHTHTHTRTHTHTLTHTHTHTHTNTHTPTHTHTHTHTYKHTFISFKPHTFECVL